MRGEIVRELAAFRGAAEHQVDLWDGELIDYFLRQQEKFQLFRRSSASARQLLWLEGLQASRPWAAAGAGR